MSECTKSELDLFCMPPTQTAIEEGKWDTINAETGFATNDMVTFKIQATDTHYLDLSETQIFIKLKLMKDVANDGTLINILDTDRVAPVNNILHSLFKQIKVKLNEKDVENSNCTYSYRSYIENLLSHGRDSKETFLMNEGWSNDTPTKFNTTTLQVDGGNVGFITRNKWLAAGEIELCAKIHSDVFNINRYLLNKVDVSIEFTKNDQKFYLMSETAVIGATMRPQISAAYLQVRRATISPSVMYAHTMALTKCRAKYPIKRVVVKTFTKHISASCIEQDLHNGIMPNRVIIGFLKTQSSTGSYDGDYANPYNFENLGAISISLTAASASLPYSKALKFNYTSRNYMEAYNTLFSNIKGISTDINYKDYAGGNTLYAFDLTPDMCNSDHYSIMKSGTLNVTMTLGANINYSITMVVHM